jgi:hypothetical protein
VEDSLGQAYFKSIPYSTATNIIIIVIIIIIIPCHLYAGYLQLYTWNKPRF